MRASVCEPLAHLGVSPGDDARVRVLVVVADEAAEIAAQAVALVSPRGA